jgi:probable F420-dependent oxidoreductase
VHDLSDPGALFGDIEAAGYDAAYTFESSRDPFLPLAAACATTSTVRLGTAVAIGFARNPMVLANIGNDLQAMSAGRFALGLGSQIKPHIEKRFSETWSHPAARMQEMVEAIRAIWEAWQTGGALDFRGRFYTHTLMTPAFDPGPNAHGPPPILVGGFGPKMVAVAGSVADGLIVHPFNSRRSLEELVLPALDSGLAASGRSRSDVEVVWTTNVVTWRDERERDEILMVAKGQLAFYGSTPAYRPTLELHGWGHLQPELNRLSKEGRWPEMIDLVPDEMVDALTVTGPRDEIADRLRERMAGLDIDLGLTQTRSPDPDHFADIVRGLRRS